MSCCPPNSLPANPTASDATPIKAGNTDDFFYDNATTSTLVLVFPDIYDPDSHQRQLRPTQRVLQGGPSRPFELLVAKIHNIVAHFQANHGVTTFGAVGYCWGAWIVAKCSADSSTELSAGVSFHPSWRVEERYHGEGSGAKIAESITVPQLILTAGNDPKWLKP
ncbi:hypothetical protein DYB34_009059 [Aphanomyces astaci]|uniref:Dienelactone hydrolase domain-containing protein n=1 Tax=Aphanomyces astaci TaxID=112090 RepID=A0A418C3T9_APHAT|nr:hypothetical protein DYB34_009059 [Aphanomyces astaci]